MADGAQPPARSLSYRRHGRVGPQETDRGPVGGISGGTGNRRRSHVETGLKNVDVHWLPRREVSAGTAFHARVDEGGFYVLSIGEGIGLPPSPTTRCFFRPFA